MNTLCVTFGFLSLVALPMAAPAQSTIDPLSGLDAAQAPHVVELPQTTYWRFGLQINGQGRTTGIQATLPVPASWPEQQVETLSIDKTPNVNSAKIKKLGSDARQLYIKINRLDAGQTAEATVLMRIEKLESSEPNVIEGFRLAESVPGSVKKYLSPSPYIESDDSRIAEIARQISLPSSAPAWDQVKTIYEWVRDNIDYRFDPQIRSCLEALDKGHGDCEEMSSLFIAICRARGIPARAVWIPAHTYPEFYLVDEQGEGRWFPCQAAGSYAFGHMPEARPILQKGDKFRVSGHREPLRYIQPTLKARDAAAAPTIKWIMTQVERPEN